MLRFCLALLLGAPPLFFAGCSRHNEDDAQISLGREDAECVIVIAVDLSGSFADRMTRQGKGYDFTSRVIDTYFKNSIGTSNRIIIAQLSAEDRTTLLWDGTPVQLRQAFPSASDFRHFLLSKSNPNGSRLHDGVADALDYVLSEPSVEQGKTKRLALFVLSDFDDNAPNPDQSEKRLVQSLQAFSQKSGIVGFYFLDQPKVPIWRGHLRKSGIKNWVCESEIVAYPALPSFE